MVWKAEEWQGGSGIWYCNCISDLANGSGTWYIPARILGISPAQFISLLFNEYKPDYFHYNKEKSFCMWGWTNQSKERLYKNWINKKAREVNFQI